MNTSRRNFLRNAPPAIFCLLMTGGLVACGGKNRHEAGLAPPDEIKFDPRTSGPLPAEIKQNKFDPRKTPYAQLPRWATNEKNEILRDSSGKPLIEGLNLPPLADNKGNQYCLYTVFDKDCTADDLTEVVTITIVDNEKKARDICRAKRKAILAAALPSKPEIAIDAETKAALGGEEEIRKATNVDLNELKRALLTDVQDVFSPKVPSKKLRKPRSLHHSGSH